MSNDPAAFPGAAMPMTRERLVASWTEKAAWLTRCGVPGAGIYRQCLAEIEQLWTDEDQRWLTAAAAAEASGYTEDHLRRMARDRSIVAEKRRGAWWYMAGSLPRKGSGGRKVVAFDPSVAARRALDRQSGDTMGDNTEKRGDNVDQEAA